MIAKFLFQQYQFFQRHCNSAVEAVVYNDDKVSIPEDTIQNEFPNTIFNNKHLFVGIKYFTDFLRVFGKLTPVPAQEASLFYS
jgi:hypothetical protein